MSSIFSEGHGIVGDALLNSTGVEEARVGVREDIAEKHVRDGLLLTLDCPYCGLQWKSVLKWIEFQHFYLGQQVPNTQATKAGVCVVFGCKKCSNVTMMTLSWADVERHVGHGIKVQALSPDLPRARAEIAKQRAEAAARKQSGRR